MNESTKNLSITSLGIVSLIGVIALQASLDHVAIREPGKELLYLPDSKVFHALALGDDAAAADIVWLRGVFYIAANDVEEKQEDYYHELKLKTPPAVSENKPVSFTETDFRNDPILRRMFFWNLNSNDAPHLMNLAERVSDLDPRFVTPYIHAASNLAMFFGRYPEARAILDRGVINCPDDWEPLYHRGFLRLFYENDKQGAASDIRRAAMLPGAPTIVIQLAAALEVGVGNRDVAIEFLLSLRELTTDEVLKKKIDDMLAVYGKGSPIASNAKKNEIGKLIDSLLTGDLQ